MYSHKTIQNELKIQLWKDRFAVLRKEVAKEKEKWIEKYNKLEQQLAKAKDCVYTEKARCRTLVQKQIDETDRVEKMLQNYADTLEEGKQPMTRRRVYWEELLQIFNGMAASTYLVQQLLVTSKETSTWHA